jgi:hypothetical protein
MGPGTHGGLEPDACRLLRHLSYARTTLDFQERDLDGAGRDVDEYKRATGRTVRHILMNLFCHVFQNNKNASSQIGLQIGTGRLIKYLYVQKAWYISDF